MSWFVPLRVSVHVTIAPPELSETIPGESCWPAPVARATPPGVHWGTPAAFTRCANIWSPLWLSLHVIIAPPAWSETITEEVGYDHSTPMKTPSGIHWRAPEASTRWARMVNSPLL